MRALETAWSVLLRALSISTHMANVFALPEELPAPQAMIKDLVHRNSNWKSRGAVFGLGAGFSAPIFGLIVTAISWLTDPDWHGFSLHLAGTLLFVLALPLLILGAHCLDLLDKESKLAHASRRSGPGD